MQLRRLLLAAAAGVLLAPVPARAQRLPGTVTPEHYDLAFNIHLARSRFDGRTGIDVRVAQPTTTIRLNALDLSIRTATIAAGGRTQTASVTMNRGDETATLTVPAAVPAGPARIEIAYDAMLNQNLRGLYESRTDERTYAVTQFESTDARRAFPCFDEPAFKATFSLTVTAARGDIAISNGRMTSDTPGPLPTQHTMTFSPTAKMSSYLVALAVGDFQCLDGGADGIPIRICATPDKKDLGHIALEASQRVMSYLNRYNTIRYPFGKLDVVAVPDFAAGAMENTGAIFYRETDLLADSRTASLAARKNIYSILAHEMAHQWFGDLVTMAWWDDLWLNESFATWMAPRAVAALEPGWHMDVEAAEESQIALNLDALGATHPIHVDVSTPSEIESVFDRISYEKGASVLRMLESYVGPEVFQKGVNAYLERHKYANATSEDFLGAIEAASGKPVARVIGTFVLQPGVPELDVTAACTDGRQAVTLTQRRFTFDASANGTSRERWQIPVCMKTADGGRPSCLVFSEPTQTVESGGACAPWVFANAGGKGYYRTAYPPEMLRSLARDAERSLTAPERLSLVSDEWALVRAGRHTVANYLDLASGFGREPIAGVLSAIVERFDFIGEYLAADATRAPFRSFVGKLLDPAYSAIGFDRRPADSEDDRSLRNVVLDALGLIAEEPQVVGRARDAVSKALDGSSPLDPILANTLVTIAASHGDAALFDAFRTAAAKASNPQEHYRYLYALADFRDPALVQRALELTATPEIRSQDAAIYLASFFQNEAARDRAWTFVKGRWSELEPKVTISLGDIALVSSLSSFCSAESRDDIRGFFTEHELPAAARALRQTIERIDNCIATRQRQQPALAEWLAER
jgi:puromycin-sensitive aminopeptidase